jgi:hypothetical protein
VPGTVTVAPENVRDVSRSLRCVAAATGALGRLRRSGYTRRKPHPRDEDLPMLMQTRTEAPPADPVARRRTFAIISHPDAGKTTLTEKLLLFGGAIQLAGEVKAKRNRVSTRSDWMGIEKERGISVVTSVMTF